MMPAVLAAAQTAPAANPLLAPWTGPYGGVPPFDRVEAAHFGPAFEAALAERRAEIEAIVANPEAPTFENTVAALERAGATLRARRLGVRHVRQQHEDPSFQAVEREWSPKMAAANDEIAARTPACSRASGGLRRPRDSAADSRAGAAPLAHLRRLRPPGARLTPGEKERLAAINQELAALYTEFGQKVLADENTWTVLERRGRPRRLAGVAVVASAKAAAAERGLRRQVGGGQHPLQRRPLPHLLDATRPARAGVEGVQGAAATTATPTTPTPPSPRSCRCAPSGRGCSAIRPTPHWKLADTMAATPERARRLLREACGSPPSRGCARRSPTCRRWRRRRAPGSPSSPGTTSTMRRRCARRSTTSTRTS